MAPTTTIRPASDTLHRVLDEELQLSPSFRQRYSNHLAMMLVALDQMGAPSERLTRVLERHLASAHEPRLDRPALEDRIAEVARDGVDATVRRRVPALAHAPDTALFHPLIRLAYALDAGHEGQVAAALLDWETRLHHYPAPEAAAGERTLWDVADALSAQPAGTWSSADLGEVARHPRLAEALDGLDVEGLDVDTVVRFALDAHVAANSFYTLHLVTGARALERVSRLVDPATTHQMVAAAAQAMVLAYAASGAPRLLTVAELEGLRRLSLPSVAEVEARAVVSSDAHVVKLANVALVEERRTGDPLYRYVAARVVDLLWRDPAA